MKKLIILGGLIVLMFALNAGFWYWSKSDSHLDNIIITKDGLTKKGWKLFIESKIFQFEYPDNFLQERSLTGFYWFEPVNKKIALAYEKFIRDRQLTLAEQVAKNFIKIENCAGQSQVGAIRVFQSCPYAEAVYTIVVFEHENFLKLLFFDHRYISTEDILYSLSTLTTMTNE